MCLILLRGSPPQCLGVMKGPVHYWITNNTTAIPFSGLCPFPCLFSPLHKWAAIILLLRNANSTFFPGISHSVNVSVMSTVLFVLLQAAAAARSLMYSGENKQPHNDGVCLKEVSCLSTSARFYSIQAKTTWNSYFQCYYQMWQTL